MIRTRLFFLALIVLSSSEIASAQNRRRPSQARVRSYAGAEHVTVGDKTILGFTLKHESQGGVGLPYANATIETTTPDKGVTARLQADANSDHTEVTLSARQDTVGNAAKEVIDVKHVVRTRRDTSRNGTLVSTSRSLEYTENGFELVQGITVATLGGTVRFTKKVGTEIVQVDYRNSSGRRSRVGLSPALLQWFRRTIQQNGANLVK